MHNITIKRLHNMEELTLTTPSIMFSAISLIMLAYTNRFLAYAQLVRNLKDEFNRTRTKIAEKQLLNLTKRLYLVRSMQIFGVMSLLLCVLCTLFIYVDMQISALVTFGVALILLVVSLAISVNELLISVKALEYHLDDIKNIGKDSEL